MVGFIYSILEAIGLHGIGLHILSSVLLAFILCAFVLGIGTLVNYIEIMQMQLMMKIMSRKKAMVICNYITCIGTIIHELSHAIMAFATGAKVTEVKLLELSKNGRLGHVSFKTCGSKMKQSWQLAMTSCAPTLNGILWCYILFKVLFLYRLSAGWTALLVYLLISIFDHMSMSEADSKNYMKGMFIVFPIMTFLMFIAVYLYAARIKNGS